MPLWVRFSAVIFVIGSAVYWAQSALFAEFKGRGSVFEWISHPYESMFRMIDYQSEYPYQYWAVMSLSFGLVAALWARMFSGSGRWTRRISGLAVIPVATVLASVPGAMLWAFHDMLAGRFQGFPGSLNYMIRWIPEGLYVGLALMVISIPFNVIMTCVGLYLMHRWGRSSSAVHGRTSR
jgi:hypothetical protein